MAAGAGISCRTVSTCTCAGKKPVVQQQALQAFASLLTLFAARRKAAAMLSSRKAAPLRSTCTARMAFEKKPGVWRTTVI